MAKYNRNQSLWFYLTADCNEVFWKLLDEILKDKNFIKPLFKKYMAMLNARGITSVKEIGFDKFSGFQNILSELESEEELKSACTFYVPTSRRECKL